MFGQVTTIPASNDLSNAYSLLVSLSDPKATKERLDEINAATLILKQHQDAVAQGRAELEQRESDFKDRVESVDDFHQSLMLKERTLGEKEDTLNKVQSSVSKRESDAISKEQANERVEAELMTRHNQLNQWSAEIRGKHEQLDA